MYVCVCFMWKSYEKKLSCKYVALYIIKNIKYFIFIIYSHRLSLFFVHSICLPLICIWVSLCVCVFVCVFFEYWSNFNGFICLLWFCRQTFKFFFFFNWICFFLMIKRKTLFYPSRTFDSLFIFILILCVFFFLSFSKAIRTCISKIMISHT